MYLNKSTSCKAAKGVPQAVANKANDLGSPRACWNHVKNFHYEYYRCDNKKKGLEKTLSDKAGNCYDLNNLFKYMCRQLGYTAHVQCGHKCGTVDHCVAYVTINGQKWLVDCTCKRKFVKAKKGS